MQETSNPTYDSSNYWKKLITHYNEVIRISGYEHFKRTANSFFTGCNDFEDLEKHTKEWWSLFDSIYPWAKSIKESEIGDPVAFEVNGRLVSLDLAYSVNEYVLLSNFIDFRFVDVINEVGAGYGRTASVILELHPNITYNIFDIEPVLSLSRRYLNDLFKGKDINMTFSTPENISGKCDIFLAIDCLHEMPRDTVQNYFKYIDENARSFYYTFSEEYFSKKSEGFKPIHEICWDKNDYPVNKDWIEKWNGVSNMRRGYFDCLYFNNRDIKVVG